MSEIVHPEAPENPLVVKLAEMGPVEFTRACKRGEIPSLTDAFLENYQFEAIQKTIEAIPKTKLEKVNVPKLLDGKIVSKDGYVEHEERMVFSREWRLKELLEERRLDMKAWKRWEASQNVAQRSGS